MEAKYIVTGMTCGNCVAHVTEEVKELDGVQDVRVQLEGGEMVIVSDEPLAFEDVVGAVKEAGDDYTVTEA